MSAAQQEFVQTNNQDSTGNKEAPRVSVYVPHHATFNYGSYRWVVRDNALQMLPNSARRSFNWSYLLSRTLRRLTPRRHF
jgi:hypothetical protein